MSSCKHCEAEIQVKKTPETPHYARKDCPNCGFLGWKSKPDNQRSTGSNLSPKKIFEFHNQEEERCFFCRRKKEDLGRNETFTLDHIHELNRGGKDEKENLQVLCTACHKLKNHQRLYHNWHHKEEK